MFLLIMVIVIACGVGFFFFATKTTVPEKPVQPSQPKQRFVIPPRPEAPSAQNAYSSAVSSPGETHTDRKRIGAKHASIAIIVDDMGSSTSEANSLIAIGVPITFSIIPGLAKVRSVADAARASGIEVMLHIPMEPKGYPQKPFEKNGLLLSLSDEETEKRMEAYITAVPHIAGANNHMGSKYTEDRGKMVIVLKRLKNRGLYFIDSKTSSDSVGENTARGMGIPTASRHVFLDNTQDMGAIRTQLEQLAEVARRHGSAIGICHPHKATIQALAAMLPAMRQSGITFVRASAMVH